MADEKLSPERAVRVLRAKAAELEAEVKLDHRDDGMVSRLTYAVADIAFIAGLLAEHIERSEQRFGQVVEMILKLTERVIDPETRERLTEPDDPIGRLRLSGGDDE